VGLLVALLLVVISAGVVLLVSAPLRARPGQAGPGGPRKDDLLAAREAKYREIRDAEFDYRTGKLSQADYETVDATLRAEALEILDSLERFESAEGGLGQGTLEQHDGEHEEEDREEDGPAV
jgi:hypothetical protein